MGFAEGPDWALPQEEPDPYKDMLQYQLYHRPDPFRLLSNDWLEGVGPKEDFDFNEDADEALVDLITEHLREGQESPSQRMEREAQEAEKEHQKEFQEHEMMRMVELVNDKGDGWKLWLRGRDFRSEFKIQDPKDFSKRGPNRSATEELIAQEKAKIKKPRKVKGKKWIRAPTDAREPKGELMCWREDFVDEARTDANLLGLERPTIPADKMRELARLDWENINKFYWYVEAVNLDGDRELWSPCFVGYLWEYWKRSQFGDHVAMAEAQLEAQAKSEGLRGLMPTGLSEGLFMRKPVDWPKPIWKPPYLKIKPEVFHIVDKPDLPPLPRRFQNNLFYKNTELERNLERNLRGTEAWDAMVGTSDRLQAAGRRVLQGEKFAAALAIKKAEAQARREFEEEERRRAEAGEKTMREIEEERLAAEEEEKERLRLEEEAAKGPKYRKKKLGDVEALQKAKPKAKGKAKAKKKKKDKASSSEAETTEKESEKEDKKKDKKEKKEKKEKKDRASTSESEDKKKAEAKAKAEPKEKAKAKPKKPKPKFKKPGGGAPNAGVMMMR